MLCDLNQVGVVRLGRSLVGCQGCGRTGERLRKRQGRLSTAIRLFPLIANVLNGTDALSAGSPQKQYPDDARDPDRAQQHRRSKSPMQMRKQLLPLFSGKVAEPDEG